MNDFAKKLCKEIALEISLDIFKFGVNVIKSVNQAIIIVDEDENGFDRVNKALYNVNPNKYSKYRVPTENIEILQLSPGANYTVKLSDNTFAHVISECKENKHGPSMKRLTIQFHGKDKFKYREKFSRYVSKRKSSKYIEITPVGSRGYYNPNRLIPISFDRVILKEEVKNRIINGLRNWSNDKQWYSDNKMVHKIGVLLYGSPGTGKSTITRCISNMFGNADILSVNGSDVKTSAMEIIYRRRTTIPSEILIVLLEDFDMFVNNRENNNDNDEDDCSKDENMNALFQMLDGIYSTNNTIYIATTNYINSIDPALIRAGRFDIQEELTYFYKEDCIEYIRGLGMDASILDALDLSDVEFPVQPSLLRSRILEYRSQKYINGGN